VDVTALVLAAGSSVRMGRPKALLPWGGETFLARIARVLLAGGATRVRVIVGGPHRAAIEAAVHALAAGAGDIAPIENPAPAEGPVTSVRAGIAAVPATDAYLIHPVDIPALEPEDVAALIARATADPALDAVVPSVRMRRAHPLLLRAEPARSLLAEGAPGTVREWLRSPGIRLVHVVLENEGLLRDIDEPGDLPAERD
jgi:molybdenum cofactor cytidylyltransferase